MQNRSNIRARLLLGSFAALVAVQATPAIAQEAAATEAADDAGADIIVTATKRPTTELQAPVSLTVVSGDALEARGLSTLSDLGTKIPSLNIGTGQPTDSIFVRGVGSGTDRGFEQSVGLFMDGVYLPRSRQYRAAFLDVGTVEVLRGPQALLYGLNATAGTIIVNTGTTKPGDKTTVDLLGEYEFEYGQYAVQAVAGTSVGDKLGLRVAARYSNADKGYYFNTTTGKNEGATEEIFVRGTASLAASEAVSVTGKLTYLKTNREGGAGECFTHPLAVPPTVAVGRCDGVLDFRRQTGGLELLSQVTGNRDAYFDQRLLIGSLNVEAELGSHTLNAVIGYTDTKFSTAFDVANLGVPLFANAHFEKHRQYNTEIRLASDDSNAFSYLVGVYYGNQKLHQEIPTATTFALPPAIAFPGSDSKTETISPFVSFTYKFTDALKLIAGGRYSHDSKSATRFVTRCERLIPGPGFATHTNGGPTANCGVSFPNQPGTFVSPDFKSGNFMPEATLFYELADNANVYAKYGRSVKSGGHTLASAIANAASLLYKDEKAETFEAGLKGRFLDNKMTLKLSAFSTKYKDLQVNSFVITGTPPVVRSAITNAGASKSQGVEIDTDFRVNRNFSLGMSGSFLDSKYTDYVNGACGVGQRPNSPLGGCIKTGQRTPFAPKFSGTVFADVTLPVTDAIDLVGGASVFWSEKFFAENTLDPFVAQGAYSRFDARIGIASSDRNWSLTLIGKNLSDERILGSSQSIGIQGLGHLNPPRTIMLQAKYGF